MIVFSDGHLYRRRVNGIGLTGSPVILALDRVDPGKIRVISHLTIENKTNSYTKFRLAIFDGATNLAFDEADYPQKYELLVHNQDIILGELDQLHAILTGTTTGDVLELLAIGYENPRESRRYA